jgi:gamma-glutamylcyclotransferase (GGCT)/AIG2-like uncharacterized protein YtfP
MRLFCYGTLQFAGIMYQVSGCRLAGVPATLEHYACFTVRGELFPGVVPEQGAQTPGVIYTGLGNAALRRLDAFESDCYVRERVCVSDASGQPLQAWAYVVRPDARAQLSNRPWERDVFERVHMDMFMRRLAG